MGCFKKIILVLFAFFFVLIFRVFAQNTFVKSVTITNTSGDATATKVDLDNDTIDPDVIFRNVGDSVSYEITINDNYELIDVTNDSQNEKVSSQYEIQGNKILLTLNYIEVVHDSFQFAPIYLKGTVKKNGTNTPISIFQNPKTSHFLPFFSILLFLLIVTLFFKRGRKAFFLLFVFLIPFIVYAEDSEVAFIKIDTSNIYFAYYINFNKSSDISGNMDELECYYGVACSLPLHTFSKDNYAFLGWTVEEDGDVVYYDGDHVMDYNGQLLYPVWIYINGVDPSDVIFTGEPQAYSISRSGQYELEVWGAQGGSFSSNYYGGKGGYSHGRVYLQTNDIIFVNVGGQGTDNSTSFYGGAGGFNGGGNGGNGTDYNDGYLGYGGSGGGGATDIRIGSNSLYARVIVAGGGGGVGGNNTYGWGEIRYPAGAGGGLEGIKSGTNDAGSDDATTSNPGLPGTQTAGGAGGAKPTFSSSGTDGSYHGSGGGGGGAGWYGGGGGSSGICTGGSGIYKYEGFAGSFGVGGNGGSNSNESSYHSSAGGNGSGGSGYVYTSSTSSYYPEGCLLNSSYYLTNAETINGDMSFPSPNGGYETGHTGNGYARVTYLG